MRRLILSALGVFILFGLPAPTWGCRCSPTVPAKTAYHRAAIVVVAKVVKVVPDPAIKGIAADLSVSEVWKTDLSPNITVRSGTSCRYEMKADTEYLLYLLKEPDGSYSTSKCLGNSRLDVAQKALKWLRANGKPGKLQQS